MNLPRSTYYYRPTEKAEELTDAALTSIIEDIQDEFPCYGYRRMTQELRRHGFIINHKRVARVMRLAGLGIRPRRRFVRTTDSRHDSPLFPNITATTSPIIQTGYHNAQAESFMNTMKVEEVCRAGYETFAHVTTRLPIFIEQVYNAKRLHSALGYRTSEEYETLLARKAA